MYTFISLARQNLIKNVSLSYNKMEIFSLLGDFRMEGDSSASMEAMMGFSGFGECFFKDGANIHRNLWITFFIVKVASGIARGCICTVYNYN